MAAAVSRPFTNSEAIACLHDIINAFKLPENNIRIEEARDNAGNNMMQMMQIVFPVTTEIQMGVITKYGFSADGDGMIRFSQTIKNFEKLDPEIAELNAQIRTYVMPQMDAPPPMQ
ncbi:unnamed protein product [Owenia fusiformis]|uniref:Protein C10 n=1 Tax=Owenia fusiformis TaxID=6347 RepID=A0A8J1UHY8_OWEFU|nr:unnamed protein product [Owenia fusiformis]